jgi:hypothetical protein
MTNRQFNFSLGVSVALIIVGALILSQATVGLSLIGLGFAIAALALVTRLSGTDQAGEHAPARIERSRDRAGSYQSGAVAE